MEDFIDFSTTVNINGFDFFKSPAHTLASYICNKKYNGFRFSKENGFMNSLLYIEFLVQKGDLFIAEKYSEKKYIGNLLYLIDKDQICFRRDIVKREKIDINFDNYFAIQYELFNCLRDTDLIEISTNERKIRHKEEFIYRITKHNALKNGIKNFGLIFFIPKTDFTCRKKEEIQKNSKKLKQKRKYYNAK